MLEPSFWEVEVSGTTRNRHHDTCRCIDVGAAAITCNVLASGVLFHNGSWHHVRHHVDRGAAATMYIIMDDVMASGDLFHDATTNHVPITADLGAAATRYIVVMARAFLYNATTLHGRICEKSFACVLCLTSPTSNSRVSIKQIIFLFKFHQEQSCKEYPTGVGYIIESFNGRWCTPTMAGSRVCAIIVQLDSMAHSSIDGALPCY
jgi:hypothetical protein